MGDSLHLGAAAVRPHTDRPALAAYILSLRKQIEFCEVAGPSPELLRYVARHELNWQTIMAHAGPVAVCLCETVSHNRNPRFVFDPEGEAYFVCEARAENAVDAIDLVAWPLDRPEDFVTAMGPDAGADVLGIPAMCNPATYAGGMLLTVHRTPLAWLKAGCQGCVPLHPTWGAYWLSRTGRPFLAEDLQHARALKAALPIGSDSGRLMVRQ